MRDLFLSIAISVGLIWGLFSAPGSIIVLNWICFQRPHDFSWGLWNILPTFQIALFIAIFSNLVRRQLYLKFPPLLVIYLAFLSWITISCFFAYDPDHAWQFYKIYLPPMWVTPVLLFATIHELKLLKWLIWVFVGGVGLNAFKVALIQTVRGGGYLTEQVSGFVGDNNVFGLVLCLVVAILIGLRKTLPKKWWLRFILYIVIGCISLCIIYTKSRGALLSLGVIIFLSCLLSGKPIRNFLLTAILVGSIYAAIPSKYFDRLSTLNNIESDVSAMGRVENWILSWHEALDHPLFGVGLDNHMLYNIGIQVDVKVRVAHSTYFQTLGELGFPGLGLYLCFIILGLWTLFKTWRVMVIVVKSNPDLAWVQDVAFWMTCGYIGYMFGSGLLNMLYIEFPWYVVFYGAMLRPLVEQELARRGFVRPTQLHTTDVSLPARAYSTVSAVQDPSVFDPSVPDILDAARHGKQLQHPLIPPESGRPFH